MKLKKCVYYSNGKSLLQKVLSFIVFPFLIFVVFCMVHALRQPSISEVQKIISTNITSEVKRIIDNETGIICYVVYDGHRPVSITSVKLGIGITRGIE